MASCDSTVAAHRNRIRVLEWGAHYYIRPQFRVSLWWDWTDVANTLTSTQVKVGCSRNTTNTNAGKSCDWHTINLILNANF